MKRMITIGMHGNSLRISGVPAGAALKLESSLVGNWPTSKLNRVTFEETEKAIRALLDAATEATMRNAPAQSGPFEFDNIDIVTDECP